MSSDLEFLRIVRLGKRPPAAELGDGISAVFRLNAKGLRDRIANVRGLGGDSSVEEEALRLLEAEEEL